MPEQPLDILLGKLRDIRTDLRDEYLQPHEKPWIVGFSGGKDSTLVLQLVFETLLELPPSRRTRQVHVLSNDTLVESPVVQAYVDKTMSQLHEAVDGLGLPISVEKTTPDVENTFWVNLIGRGYPAPNRLFRWCTDRMKIRPTTQYMDSLASSRGGVILLLGVRRLESTARAKVMKRYDNGERLNPHNDVDNCMVFRPIVDMTTDEVWMTLLQLRPPWGGSHRELVTLYKNAQEGECPLVTDKSEAPSCGTTSARFGCWTCTVVEKDRSIRAFIENGFESLEPLADFRDWLKEYSLIESGNRMTTRRNGNDGYGPFTLEARSVILTRLMGLQTELDLPLISEVEVARIHQIWRDDACMTSIQKANKLLNIL